MTLVVEGPWRAKDSPDDRGFALKPRPIADGVSLPRKQAMPGTD
jgi:hypothetical protein